MTRKKIILYLALGAVSLTVGIFAFIGLQKSVSVEPEPIPNPAPTASIQDGPVATAAPGPSEGPVDVEAEIHDETGTTNLDLTAFQDMAVAAVREYSTFNTDETLAARDARIAAATGPDSPLAGKVTDLSLPRHDESTNWSARSGLVGTPYAGVTSDNGDSLTFAVTADYWGSYGSPETQSQQSTGTWTLTIGLTSNADGTLVPTHVNELTEPEFLLE